MFTSKTKSTLPAVRRLAGESLRDEKERLTDDRLMPFIFAPIFLWVVFLVEAVHAWTTQPPQPFVWLVFALIGTALGIRGLRRLMPEFRKLNRGERGERRVSEVLDDLRSSGYHAFHDLRGQGFNIDHVLVGPAGIFAVETKFRSGQGEITFRNGQGLFVGGVPEEKDSLKQARGNAAEVRRILKDNCGVDRWVKPLVVFVGDWRVKDMWRETDARVLNVDQLGRYFGQRQPELTRGEIKLIASHLERSAKS